jgi:succinate dehydrogenase / fumarate reductase, iron-sulfur subunit
VKGAMKIRLEVWRQKNAREPGSMVAYEHDQVDPDMSFLEMLDVLNEKLILRGEEPIAFEHDCREGICGSCSLVINGNAHGPEEGTASCQLHMRHFRDGDTIHIEPFRAKAFPVIKDLVVDRSAFDRINAAGGYISVSTGAAPSANAVLVPKNDVERALDAAACIQCGACVAACKNASAMLFVSARLAHLGRLPQGQPERKQRARAMVRAMDAEGFGNCTNENECEAACPKSISVQNIARMNRDWLWSNLSADEPAAGSSAG